MKYISLTEEQQKLAVQSIAHSGEIWFKGIGKVKWIKHKGRKGTFNSKLQGNHSKEVDYIQGNWSTARKFKEIIKKIIK